MPVEVKEGRWLRHKRDKTIYAYSEILAGNSAVEEVSEMEAFPQKFIPEKQRGRKSDVDLSDAAVPDEEPPTRTSPELAREATQNLPSEPEQVSDLPPPAKKRTRRKKAAAK